MPNQKIL
jgi:hypothetical protein